MNDYVDILQFRSDSLVKYTQHIRTFEGLGYSRNTTQMKLSIENKRKQLKLHRKQAYSGEMTEGSKKRLQKALDVFYFRSPLQHVFNPVTNRTQSFKYVFITLTLAGNHSDKEATQVHKDLLEPFLRWLRDSKKVTDYIWKAELQIVTGKHT